MADCICRYKNLSRSLFEHQELDLRWERVQRLSEDAGEYYSKQGSLEFLEKQLICIICTHLKLVAAACSGYGRTLIAPIILRGEGEKQLTQVAQCCVQ